MRRSALIAVGAAVLALAAGIPVAHAATSATASATAVSAASASFVTRKGSQLYLNNKVFRFGGANTYYLEYASPAMVDADLAAAAGAGFQVLRTWGWYDVATPSADTPVYFQYWDGTAPAYNDGDSGLKHLDYVLYKAAQANVRLIIPFTNNWGDFGGMDQYVRWRGGTYHDEFYTDSVIKGWYQAYISHLLNRVNTYTGVAYKDDPTVMAWELANEPRCQGPGALPVSATCETTTLTSWADQMTRYIKSVDRRHLVAVGDEGFYCDDATSTDWETNCGPGVDSIALAKLPAVDYMSYHLYPDGWNKDVPWGTAWITRHIADARTVGKPAVLGEYGLRDKNTRNPVYRQWTDVVVRNGGAGALYWMLADKRDDGTLYPDYDGFTVYCPSPVCTTLTNFGTFLQGPVSPLPAPVADHDSATTAFGESVTLTPLANDIAYAGTIQPATVDFDATTAGSQTTATVTGGTFTYTTDGGLAFIPAAGFAGKASATYTVADSRGVRSNEATVSVTVKPDPNAVQILYSFEDGVQGWGLASWQDPSMGSVTTQTDFHTDGAAGLQVTTTGAWFAVNPATPLNLTGRLSLKYDLRTHDGGTTVMAALQAGPSWNWCQVTAAWVNADATTTAEIDLTQIQSCDATGLSEIHGILIWLNAGTFDIDAVRVE